MCTTKHEICIKRNVQEPNTFSVGVFSRVNIFSFTDVNFPGMLQLPLSCKRFYWQLCLTVCVYVLLCVCVCCICVSVFEYMSVCVWVCVCVRARKYECRVGGYGREIENIVRRGVSFQILFFLAAYVTDERHNLDVWTCPGWVSEWRQTH